MSILSLNGQTNLDTIENKAKPSEKKESRNTFLTLFNGKPGKAALIGLVIPSGGQAYNKKWIKIPIALGIDGAAGYWVYYTRNQFKEYDIIYKSLLDGKTHPDFNSVSDVQDVRSAWRQRSEYAWVYMTIAHLVTVFDAYVDRHLLEFDIDDDISQLYTPIGATPLFGIRIPLDTKYSTTSFRSR